MATKEKKPQTLGTEESPHVIKDGWLLESVAEFLLKDKGGEGVHSFFLISVKDSDSKDRWFWTATEPTQEKAQRFVDARIKEDRKRSIEIQRRRWERDNAVHQTKQIVTFTVSKNTSKKKIAEHAAMMEQLVQRFKSPEKLKPPKFEPLAEDIGEYKIERVFVTLRRELVN